MNQRGMTIAEVLVAVAILGVALAALTGVIPAAAYGIQEGAQLSTATFLAEQRLEQVRNATWQKPQPAPPAAPPAVDTLGVSTSPATAPVGDGAAVTFPDESPMGQPYGSFWRAVRIADCGAAPGCSGVVHSALRQVTVTVGYRPMTAAGPAPAGTRQTVSVTMYMAQR
jgi:prepilin-type N-terminal cleavage/methylation domain-containing protein